MSRTTEFIDCVRHLGLSLGWRYWRIQAKARKNPDMVLKWARDCRLVGLQDWAEQLEKAHGHHTLLQHIQDLKRQRLL